MRTSRHIYPQTAQDGPAGREPVPGRPAAETGGLSLEDAEALCGCLWAMAGVESEERCLGGR